MNIEDRFNRFNSDNPKIRDLFVRFSEEAANRGRRRIGAKLIAERIRWYSAIETNGDIFKINNNYVSRYARLVAKERPDLAFLFETRTLKS